MNIDTYLRGIPKLHFWNGTWESGGFSPEQLRTVYDFIGAHAPPHPRIVETGAGNSTLCFLHLNPERIISVAPDPGLFERIGEFCRANGIPAERLSPHVDGSQWVLPILARECEAQFDFALIDGDHNWPMAMVDFYYLNVMVKRGGFIMVDDVQLHSVKELARLLAYDPANFAIRANLGKALIFEKLTDAREFGGWWTQPYITAMSDSYRHDPFALWLWRIRPKLLASKLLLPLQPLLRTAGRLRRFLPGAPR